MYWQNRWAERNNTELDQSKGIQRVSVQNGGFYRPRPHAFMCGYPAARVQRMWHYVIEYVESVVLSFWKSKFFACA